MHLTVPDIFGRWPWTHPRWVDWCAPGLYRTRAARARERRSCACHRRTLPSRRYPLTLLLSVVWLALLAFVMTTALDSIGCAAGISSTVMGLTLGAVGTSFPNLVASILTARAGQPGLSICQAFGSNMFNLCVALGLVWLLQTLMPGNCQYGKAEPALSIWSSCDGCYMPTGLGCPYLASANPPAASQSGSLQGTVVVVFFCMLVFVLSLVYGHLHLRVGPAIGFFAVYILYAAYQVVASYTSFKLCTDSWCI